MGNIRPGAGRGGGCANRPEIVEIRAEVVVRAISSHRVFDNDVVGKERVVDSDASGSAGRHMITLNAIVAVVDINACVTCAKARVISYASIAYNLATGTKYKNATYRARLNEATGYGTGERGDTPEAII